ncbi:NAD(P)-dependent oxidoreductase [Cyanobium sp. WAJ14-Wanaka]|uniref:NAD-dependent epimerase/dehydratase family protein n=1 Tax=Cyanobium sp. WAJ14-Wanaka TaxID=2823725 RepID=UPI0020CF18D4|nr:NAD-dependent epimerase/dehydratase family protein [Cyanobium sp. WAJ14-Wanaka]MCP9775685.1 NAD-dependent epimerase/dehydratase family protein [Cyanobium sp. WAJ14-Wanaka]
MTTIHLLGSEGFIGRAIQREAADTCLHCWSHLNSDSEHHFDLLDPSTWQTLLNRQPTHAILLSWPGLPNYQEPFHVTRNLPACLDLIEQLVASGLQRLVVAGTCYEYGMQNGPLKEDQLTDPVNCYAIAKDSLRRVITSRLNKQEVQWCWIRIFYPFGTGQNPNSLLPSLQGAIDQHDPEFAMSSGRQVRDFVPVDQVAKLLLKLSNHPYAQGIYNCGSGNPVSLRELAEEQITNSLSSIVLKLGGYPDRQDEPLAYWADTSKIDLLS